MTPPAERRADLDLLLDAITEAGRAVMAWFGGDLDVRHKSPDQPVTRADLAADRVLRQRLSGARPGYGWLSEESDRDPSDEPGGPTWVVDPIDGTRSFIAGYPEFGLSVALVEGPEAVLGAVHNPASGELFWAASGAGAFSRTADGVDTRIHVLRESELRPTLIASRSEIGRGALAPFDGDWDVRPLGSTAYKLAAVAAGRADGYASRGPKNDWDVAAGVLLVTEAGGRVTDLRGEPFRFSRPTTAVTGVLAGTATAHERLVRRVAELGGAE